MLRRIIFIIIATLSLLPLSARELKVESFCLLPNDSTAQVNSKTDYNGDDCALVKVNLPLSGCVFEGIFGNATNHGNEYWVYLPESTRRFTIKCPEYETLNVEFSNISDIKSVKGGKTYQLNILPQKEEEFGKVCLNITPNDLPDLIVKIDSKVQSYSDGFVICTLPYGNHTYSITSIDYNSISGNFSIESRNTKTIDILLQPKYEYVDLGLESGTLWATFDLGTSSPEEIGKDYSIILNEDFDIAKKEWGKNWRMPTIQEFEELLKDCEWIPCRDDKHTFEVIGPNGNKIYFSVPENTPSKWSYWTKTFDRYDPKSLRTISLYHYKDYKTRGRQIEIADIRYCKEKIRPVHINSLEKESYDANGHEYVDLGLPSGLLWATCNVGAAQSKDQGYSYSYGGTEPNSLPEYCIPRQRKRNISGDKNFDAATKSWGGDWRIPTSKETDELNKYCKPIKEDTGVRLVGPNSKSIFLPYAEYWVADNSYDVWEDFHAFTISTERSRPSWWSGGSEGSPKKIRPVMGLILK